MNYFISIEDQIKNLKAWNKKYGWGFTAQDFKDLPAAPKWPQDELVAVVLVPYLKTVQKSFDALWQVAQDIYPENWRSSYAEKVSLVNGVNHTPGLRWEALELKANFNPKDGIVISKLDRTKLAGIGVLAACAHFPNWVKAMDGDKVPYALAGQLVVGSDIVPFFFCDDGKFFVSGHWAGGRWDRTAAVAFRESRPSEAGDLAELGSMNLEVAEIVLTDGKRYRLVEE